MFFLVFLASEATKELANHVFFFFFKFISFLQSGQASNLQSVWQALHSDSTLAKWLAACPLNWLFCGVNFYTPGRKTTRARVDGLNKIHKSPLSVGGVCKKLKSRTPGTRFFYLVFFLGIFDDAMLRWVWVILFKWTHWSAHGTFWELRSNAWNSDCEAPKVLRWFLSIEVVEHIWWPKKAQCTSTVSHFGVKSLGLPKASPMSGATVNDHEAASFCRFWILQTDLDTRWNRKKTLTSWVWGCTRLCLGFYPSLVLI